MAGPPRDRPGFGGMRDGARLPRPRRGGLRPRRELRHGARPRNGRGAGAGAERPGHADRVGGAGPGGRPARLLRRSVGRPGRDDRPGRPPHPAGPPRRGVRPERRPRPLPRRPRSRHGRTRAAEVRGRPVPRTRGPRVRGAVGLQPRGRGIPPRLGRVARHARRRLAVRPRRAGDRGPARERPGLVGPVAVRPPDVRLRLPRRGHPQPGPAPGPGRAPDRRAPRRAPARRRAGRGAGSVLPPPPPRPPGEPDRRGLARRGHRRAGRDDRPGGPDARRRREAGGDRPAAGLGPHDSFGVLLHQPAAAGHHPDRPHAPRPFGEADGPVPAAPRTSRGRSRSS